ncbi:MAG: TonB-dependent receptor plug domain-containing protein, partial [candidate division Zixibacteria bacterium]|nr:TonB-dependent receptor plug domain-containing protein [candidate division Zixibacteria bacterium]
MKKIALVFLLTCLTFFNVYSQNTNNLTGKVLDRYTRLPVSGASVQIVGTVLGTVVDDNGRFEINRLTDSVVTVKISMIGYETVRREVSFNRHQSEDIKIFLRPVDIPVDKITVTASRFAEVKFTSPSNISITPEAKFDERTYSTTAEVLREEPGVLVQKTTAGHGAPIIRGLIGRYILLLYDGIRLSKPTFRFGANQYMNTVDLESLDRIEVFRGPSSVMYGSDAIGGAVNLIPALQPMGGSELVVSPSLTSHYSSYDEGRSVNLTLNGNYQRLSSSFVLSYKKFGDLTAGGDIEKQSPTGWEETNFNTRLRYALTNNSSVGVDYLAVRQKNVPRFDKYVCGDFEEYVYDPQDRDLAAVTYEIDNIGSFIQSFKGNLSYQREREGSTTRK